MNTAPRDFARTRSIERDRSRHRIGMLEAQRLVLPLVAGVQFFAIIALLLAFAGEPC